jgi:hypothetical protein
MVKRCGGRRCFSIAAEFQWEMIRLLVLYFSLLIAAPALDKLRWCTRMDPAADYVTAGQDEPGYRSWYMALPSRSNQIKAFNDYLSTYEVSRNRSDLAAISNRNRMAAMRRSTIRNSADQRMAATSSKRFAMCGTMLFQPLGRSSRSPVYRNPILQPLRAGGAPGKRAQTLFGDRPRPLAPRRGSS